MTHGSHGAGVRAGGIQAQAGVRHGDRGPDGARDRDGDQGQDQGILRHGAPEATEVQARVRDGAMPPNIMET